jgi:hypothetical protein
MQNDITSIALYELEHATPNPGRDNRVRHDWRRAPTWEPGIYALVIERDADIGRIVEYIVPAHDDGMLQWSAPLRKHDRQYSALAARLRPIATERLDSNVFLALLATGAASGRRAIKILQALVTAGKVSMSDVLNAG